MGNSGERHLEQRHVKVEEQGALKAKMCTCSCRKGDGASCFF